MTFCKDKSSCFTLFLVISIHWVALSVHEVHSCNFLGGFKSKVFFVLYFYGAWDCANGSCEIDCCCTILFSRFLDLIILVTKLFLCVCSWIGPSASWIITYSYTLIINENDFTPDYLRVITYLLVALVPNAPVMIISSVILESIVFKSTDICTCATTTLSLSHPFCFLPIDVFVGLCPVESVGMKLFLIF